jgi:Tfp pilus assembly protein PilV
MARAHARSPESGFSIMEAVVATLIATIAVLGLASSFGSARGLVDRYAEARVALAAAQRRMEILSVLDANAPELQIGTAHQADVVVDNAIVARESWTIAAFDDPANGTGAGQTDLKQVTVTVSWGAGAPAEQVQLVRLFPAQ